MASLSRRVSPTRRAHGAQRRSTWSRSWSFRVRGARLTAGSCSVVPHGPKPVHDSVLGSDVSQKWRTESLPQRVRSRPSLRPPQHRAVEPRSEIAASTARIRARMSRRTKARNRWTNLRVDQDGTTVRDDLRTAPRQRRQDVIKRQTQPAPPPVDRSFVPKHLSDAERDEQGRLRVKHDWRNERELPRHGD